MADGYNNADYAFILPNYFPAPGQVLQSAIAQRERQLANEAEAAERKRQYDLRQQEKDEAEAFRKMQYLQEYTDPSKYQTGLDAADAVTKDSLNNIYNKYRTLKLDPVTLADALRGEVGDLVSATTAMKNEAKAFDKMIPSVKQQFKSVNTDLLRQNFKGDLINRYIKGTGFNKTPEQSKILENLANPEYLADYTNDISSIVDVLKSKKEGERKFAFVGKSDQDVKKYGANIGFWEQPNVDITKGFLAPGTVPTVTPKSEQRTISGVNTPVSAVPDDVFMVFAKSPASQAEIISATKKRFNGSGLPAYNTLAEGERKVVILTARSAYKPVKDYLHDIGLEGMYVVALGDSDPQKKADWIEDKIKKGYNDVFFIDDSHKNVDAVSKLKEKYPNIKMKVSHVKHDIPKAPEKKFNHTQKEKEVSKKETPKSNNMSLKSLLPKDLDKKIKNPETGKMIKIKSALQYDKTSKAHKAAEFALKQK